MQAISGLMSLTGDPDGEPYRAGISVFDVMSGMQATIGILAALRHRAATGDGQHVEVNLLSSALSGLVNQASAYVAGGVVPYRMGNSHPSLFPYEPLPTADGDLIITAGNDGQFRKLCEVLGLPELVDDPRFGRNQDRTANREELRPLLVERLATRAADGVVRRAARRRRRLRADQHGRRGRRVRRASSGLDPVVVVGDGRGRGPLDPQPDHVLRDPGPLRPAAAGARRARRRDPGLAGGAARRTADEPGAADDQS